MPSLDLSVAHVLLTILTSFVSDYNSNGRNWFSKFFNGLGQPIHLVLILCNFPKHILMTLIDTKLPLPKWNTNLPFSFLFKYIFFLRFYFCFNIVRWIYGLRQLRNELKSDEIKNWLMVCAPCALTLFDAQPKYDSFTAHCVRRFEQFAMLMQLCKKFFHKNGTNCCVRQRSKNATIENMNREQRWQRARGKGR